MSERKDIIDKRKAPPTVNHQVARIHLLLYHEIFPNVHTTALTRTRTMPSGEFLEPHDDHFAYEPSHKVQCAHTYGELRIGHSHRIMALQSQKFASRRTIVILGRFVLRILHE